ncbi:MAG: efflux RND transporter periplasmic adaptor subunit [Candidatus Gracilibacteria bacterium]|jgi:RND family efflux transporter MFP subunit|nr:efflux RND transporter periplasmic adaptor subunit [Candidatus Gracilibacteria bacterium]
MFKKILIVSVILAVLSLAYFFLKPEKTKEFVTEKAKIQDIEQIVSVNGTVESNAKIRLRFQTPGKINSILKEVGDKVFKDESLASLDNEILQIQIDQATSNMEMSQAELNLKYAGPSVEDINLSNIKIKQANLALENSKKNYNDILLSNSERKRQAELQYENAKVALANAEKSLSSSGASTTNAYSLAEKNLEASYTNVEPALIIAIDAIDRAITSADTILGIDNKTANDDYDDRLGTKDPNANINAIQSYSKANQDFSNLKTEFEKFEDFKSDSTKTEDEKRSETDIVLNIADNTLFSVKDLLDKTYFALDMTPTNFIFTLESLESLKTRIQTEQTGISTQIQTVKSLIQQITTAKLDLEKAGISGSSGTDTASANFETAKNNLLIAESNLKSVEVQNQLDEHNAKMQIDTNEVLLEEANANHDKLIAKPRAVDTASLRAKIDSALASVKQLQKELSDTMIKAPIDGVLTEINVKEGENVSSSENVIVMITDKMQIKANISETDINKINVGNPVELSFDSLSQDEVFMGEIITINPAETVIDGVIYYEATVVLDSEDSRIKSGMTADMDILSAKKEKVISIPALSVEYDDKISYCFILENGQKVKREIKVGIEGNDYIEVLEGVKENEEIIIYEK